MRFAAAIFWGFAFLLLILIFAVLSFNPSRGELSFIAQTITVFGGFCGWSALAALRLRRGKGIVAACALAGILTLFIMMGWARYGSLQIKPADPLLGGLRTACGIYVLVLWGAIAWAVWHRRAPNQVSDENTH